MTEHPTENGPGFEALMADIDAGLAKEGVPIAARPLRAMGIVSARYKISIPICEPKAGMAPEIARYWPLSCAISSWFDQSYGDRLKMDFSVGRVVVCIKDDLYIIRIPRIYGKVRLIMSRQLSTSPTINIGRGGIPPQLNPLQTVQELTSAKAALLCNADLDAIGEVFMVGFHAHYGLEANLGLELIRSACGDIETAVNHLMDRQPRYGDSRWASLQATEKIMKAAIRGAGASFKFTHNLSGLADQLVTLGVEFVSKPLTDAIQCSPGIRYGEETCNRAQALAAIMHRSSSSINW